MTYCPYCNDSRCPANNRSGNHFAWRPQVHVTSGAASGNGGSGGARSPIPTVTIKMDRPEMFTPSEVKKLLRSIAEDTRFNNIKEQSKMPKTEVPVQQFNDLRIDVAANGYIVHTHPEPRQIFNGAAGSMYVFESLGALQKFLTKRLSSPKDRK